MAPTAGQNEVYPEYGRDLDSCFTQYRLLGFDFGEFGELDAFDVPSEADGLEGVDAVPIHVEFIPLQAVTRGLRRIVMVIVPAFAKGENGHPKAIPGKITSCETLRAPYVRGGIHEPGGVHTEDGAQENAPHQPGQAPDEIENHREDNRGNCVPLADPQMKFVFAQIGNVRKQL